MKKNVVFRIAAVVLMCALVTACFASSTFAKYTSGATSNDANLTVAKWQINVNDQDIYEDDATFDLTQTIINTVAGVDGSAVDKIAPGTKGTFVIEIENASDVAATFDLSLDTDALPDDLAEALVFTNDLPTDNTIAAGDDVTVTYTWTWAYERTNKDATDTAIGHSATDDGYDVTATITATQVD